MQRDTCNGAASEVLQLSNAPEIVSKTALILPNQILSGLSLLLIRWIIHSSYTVNFSAYRTVSRSSIRVLRLRARALPKRRDGRFVVRPGVSSTRVFNGLRLTAMVRQ